MDGAVASPRQADKNRCGGRALLQATDSLDFSRDSGRKDLLERFVAAQRRVCCVSPVMLRGHRPSRCDGRCERPIALGPAHAGWAADQRCRRRHQTRGRRARDSCATRRRHSSTAARRTDDAAVRRANPSAKSHPGRRNCRRVEVRRSPSPTALPGPAVAAGVDFLLHHAGARSVRTSRARDGARSMAVAILAQAH